MTHLIERYDISVIYFPMGLESELINTCGDTERIMCNDEGYIMEFKFCMSNSFINRILNKLFSIIFYLSKLFLHGNIPSELGHLRHLVSIVHNNEWR